MPLSQELLKKRDDWAKRFKQLDSPVGNVTDRSQIINPNELINPANYGLGRREQLRYESDLAQAKLYADQQEAAYQEWYDSPEQQAARQRAAGLNPDLMGVEQSQASDVSQAETSPMANIPSNEQIAFNAVSSLTSLMGSLSSVANLASSFAQLPVFSAQKELLKSQNDNVVLANINQFEKLVYNAISDKLSKAISSASEAGQSFDIPSWFSDDSNFADLLPSYAPSDDIRYSHALARVRQGSQSVLSNAYEGSAVSGQNKLNFASMLANPYMDSDVILMQAQLEPVMAAFEQLRLLERDYQIAVTARDKVIAEGVDVNSIISRQDAENSYFADYYSNFDGQSAALYDMKIKQAQSICDSASASVYNHFKQIFDNDPSSPAGRAAAFMILSGAHMSWYEYLLNNVVEAGTKSAFGSTGDADGDGVADISPEQFRNRALVKTSAMSGSAPGYILSKMLGM